MAPPKYLPFLSGRYTTAAGLKPLAKEEEEWDRRIFQLDGLYRKYLDNKSACRQEDINRYYLQSDNLLPSTIRVINRFILDRLIAGYPDQFENTEDGFHNSATGENVSLEDNRGTLMNDRYFSLFDALCCQVQEDLAVIQLTTHSDYIAAIHLCAPNHWSPARKIGKFFKEIHQPVPGMQPVLTHYRQMLETILASGSTFTRFAWGLSADDRLNHHPEPPAGFNTKEWEGRTVTRPDQPVFVRVERQTLTGFPEINALLFTIRTYFYFVDELSGHEKLKLSEAVRSMDEATLKYKGIDGWQAVLLEKLA